MLGDLIGNNSIWVNKNRESITRELKKCKTSQRREGIALPENCKIKKQVNGGRVYSYLRIVKTRNKSMKGVCVVT